MSPSPTKTSKPRSPKQGAKQWNFRLTDPAVHILEEVMEYHGLSATGAMEMILRDFARSNGFTILGSGQHKAGVEPSKRRAPLGPEDPKDSPGGGSSASMHHAPA